jgi:hypothetical protein
VDNTKRIFVILLCAALIALVGCAPAPSGGVTWTDIPTAAPSAPESSATPSPSPAPSPTPTLEPTPTPMSAEEQRARESAHGERAVFENIQLLAAEQPLTEFAPVRLTTGEIHFSADFDRDGETDDLIVSSANASDEIPDGNKPTHITLSINGAEYSYTDEWNDGISVGVVDLDPEDMFINIIVFTSSTDIDGHADIYRYDGVTIEQVFAFGVTIYAYYDGAGKVYHVAFTDGWDWETNEKINDDWGYHIYTLDLRTGTDTYECPWKE